MASQKVTSLLALLPVIPGVLSYSRPNDLSLSTVEPASYSCGAACRKLVQNGIAEDRTTVFGDIPFSYDFYATSENFSASSSSPGDLLKIEPYIHTAPASAWSLPGGTTLYRIQYVSISANDKVVPATAFVAFPFAKPVNGEPFDLVAWAHGTIGTTYGCAPSSSFNLYDYDTVIPLLNSGYAVVGADYAGLGNNYTRTYWEANSLNANDVFFSAIAAKKAFPQLLSDQWVAAGHSQGGGTAWGVAQSTHLKTAKSAGLKLLGSVALEPGAAPANEIIYAVELLLSSNATSSATNFGAVAYASYVFSAVQVFEPSLIEDIFTEVMIERQRLGNALGMCFYLEASIIADLASDGVSGIVKNITLLGAVLEQYQKAYGAGIGKKAKVPMLVVQSVADHTVPFPIVEESWNATCAAGGEPVQFSVYQALAHSAAVAASAPEWLGWIADRFAGVEGPKKCEIKRRAAVSLADALL